MSDEEIEIFPTFPMLNENQMNIDNSDSENEGDSHGDNEGHSDSSEEVMKDDSNIPPRSVAWTYFKRDQQNIKKSICNICAQVLSLPTGTTSPMFNHLRAKHKDVYKICIAEERNKKRKEF
ncbi:uncharacterized protein LOC123274805 [Cotesia glomerata]|uniref:BED-type domain-containing protein n=1 Tax=Cotesia glomerata TaxID=32391 RepID=A0AAV7J168_COTGL|nr:uncharacterized protein LOC123274805 [Cotesia glomerata]KAH0562536.1 hypothetical protein KQX54_000317 [Cotesia glomerata]